MALQLLANGKLLYQDGDLRTECCCVGYCKITWGASYNCYSGTWIDPDTPVVAGSKIEVLALECVENVGPEQDWACVEANTIREDWTKIEYIANNCDVDDDCEVVAENNVPDLPDPTECCPEDNGYCYFSAAFYWNCDAGTWEGIFACGCQPDFGGAPPPPGGGWTACSAPPPVIGGFDSCAADYEEVGARCVTCAPDTYTSSPVLDVSPAEAAAALAAGEDGCEASNNYTCYDFCYNLVFVKFYGTMVLPPGDVPYTCNGCDGDCENCTSCT
jgi:hypothetical protein